MSSFTVRMHGRDSSGRPIFTTDYMWAWLEAVKADPSVAPFAAKIIITQGAFMLRAGGGADASAGFHDFAGCIDFRLFNLTEAEAEAFVWAGRIRGAAVWRRDAAHGWSGESHIHATLGGDQQMSPGAQSSWRQYVNGTNGLANFGRDLERRPNPLVLSFTGDDMPAFDDKVPGTSITFGDALKILPGLERHFAAARKAEVERDRKQNALIRSLFADLPAAVAAAVEAELPVEGSRLTAKELRHAINTGTSDAIRRVFGSLDEEKA